MSDHKQAIPAVPDITSEDITHLNNEHDGNLHTDSSADNFIANSDPESSEIQVEGYEHDGYYWDTDDPYEEPSPSEKHGTCIVCQKRKTALTCPECGKDWICCAACYGRKDNEDHCEDHMKHCQSLPKDTLSHALVGFIWQEVIFDIRPTPTNDMIVKEFGFDRVFSIYDKTRLLDLYKKFLIDWNITPRIMELWRADGKKALGEKIKAKFEAKAKHKMGDRMFRYRYKWFLQNQHVWDDDDDIGYLMAQLAGLRAAVDGNRADDRRDYQERILCCPIEMENPLP